MDHINDLQQEIQRRISDINLDFQPAELYTPIVYSLSNGGKRLRPLLTLIACELFDTDAREAMNVALGIEIFHNFTLVHDDIMDNAPLRRGKETVYKKWDQNIAILSGDTMFALAYDHIGRSKKDILPDVLEVFTTTARQVCEGQQLDMNFESVDTVSLDEYIEMIRLKTGVLLGCCLKAGALCGGASGETAQLLYEFGVRLGISFQIKDDYLDMYGNEEAFGKVNCGDIIARKKTFLYLKAIESAGDDTAREIINTYNDRHLSDEERVRMIRFYFNDLGIREAAESAMEAYYEEGLQYLDRLNLPKEKLNDLLKIAASIMQRAY